MLTIIFGDFSWKKLEGAAGDGMPICEVEGVNETVGAGDVVPVGVGEFAVEVGEGVVDEEGLSDGEGLMAF